MELLDRLGLELGSFDGRVAVVTGAARGIGEQVARALAHLGAYTIILDILESGEEVASQIRGNTRSAEFRHIDLADLEALERVQGEILEAHGRVDILVNNASKLHYVRFTETPTALWDELHQTTVRASSFLIAKFLPIMAKNNFGVICNTVAAEGIPYGAHFSAAMVGQRSMILSLAGEVGRSGISNVSVFGFAPGVVDTPLFAGLAPHSLEFRGMTQEEYIESFIGNPGYEGLMPAEDCGASYVYCLSHAKEYHGQIADAFHPLISHGIISPQESEDEELARVTDNVDPSIWAVHDYVKGISSVNRNLEIRIEERTRELEAANQRLASQKQLIEDFSSKLSRYLPQQVYQSIFSGEIDAEIQSRRKHLTVFFSDIRDFTRKTERLEPEALSEILNTYFSQMAEIARAHGATIDKFVGDAILAFFGDPESLGAERDAEQCIQMAIEMQQCMAEHKPSSYGSDSMKRWKSGSASTAAIARSAISGAMTASTTPSSAAQ